MSPALFYLLAGIILIPAIAVVISENLFHASLSLIVSFLGIAGIYVMLSAPFVAGMQVLVYAGAIAVILLFAFMLTHDIMSPQERSSKLQQSSAALVCSILGLGIFRILKASEWEKLTPSTSPQPLVKLGESFLTDYLVPFELVSVLLLITLVGSIVIARKEEEAKVEE